MSKNELQVKEERPNFLAQVEGDSSTDSLDQFMQVSMIKLVQKQSANELLEEFGMGQPILNPEMIPIPSPFKFVPVLFYPQWMKWAPLESGEGILDSSLDPHSEVARKAQNRATWFEDRDDGKGKNRYVEHLNFIVLLPEVHSAPVVLSFAKGEHRTGRRLANLIKVRNAPIYSGVYTATPKLRPPRSGNQWYGFDIDNAGWVSSQEEFDTYKAIYEDVKARQDKIAIDFESGDDPIEDVNDSDFS